MAGLLDLPSEVILIIVEYLQSQSHEKGVLVPFYWFGDAYRETIFEHDQPHKAKDLYSLLLTSRQLKPLLQPIFYRDIFVRSYRPRSNRSQNSARRFFGNYEIQSYAHLAPPEDWSEKRPFDQLIWSLENIPSLRNLIVTAMVPCVESSAMYYVSALFWFPNMKNLTVYHFRDWEELEFENNAHVGTSVVEELRLISCGAHEEALAAVLSWPKALKTLHYDAEQGEWDGHYEGQSVKEWTCEAFVRTLQPQKETLEELVMTRPRLVHEGLHNGPPIQLRDFSALKVLRIYHVFLCGFDALDGISTRLPPNLEFLEVWYDDTELWKFLVEHNDEPPYDRFLEILVRDKKSHLPKLNKVTVYTDENLYDSDNIEELEAGRWELPAFLAHDADEAGIEINVWLGCAHYFYQPLQESDTIFRSLEISQNSRATSTAMLLYEI